MCADCGCGCKKGKPEKGCKCECKTCAGARHETKEGMKHEKEEEEVEKFFLEASEILKAYSSKQLERKRNIGLGVAAGAAGSGLAASSVSRKLMARSYDAAFGNQPSVSYDSNGKPVMMGNTSARNAKMIESAKHLKHSKNAKGAAILGGALAVGGLAQAGKSQARLSHRKSKMDVSKSAFFVEDVDKAFNPGAIAGQIKSVGTALKTGFKSGKMFGNAGVKNAVSPFGGANAAQKVKTAGFKAGNMAGKAGNYVKANPMKAAGIAGGTGLAGGMAIKKSHEVSAFGVEH